jgi:hypothetical protein
MTSSAKSDLTGSRLSEDEISGSIHTRTGVQGFLETVIIGHAKINQPDIYKSFKRKG